MVDRYGEGRAAAEAGEPRKNPFDARTGDGREWARGYDSVALTAPAPASAPAPVDSAPAPAAALLSAGESSDPEVHTLIANRRAHEMVVSGQGFYNTDIDASRAAIEVIDQRLRELGYRT